ncbi:hypothetical protein PT2222_140404 [Paraburkholderia tropica]
MPCKDTLKKRHTIMRVKKRFNAEAIAQTILLADS